MFAIGFLIGIYLAGYIIAFLSLVEALVFGVGFGSLYMAGQAIYGYLTMPRLEFVSPPARYGRNRDGTYFLRLAKESSSRKARMVSARLILPQLVNNDTVWNIRQYPREMDIASDAQIVLFNLRAQANPFHSWDPHETIWTITFFIAGEDFGFTPKQISLTDNIRSRVFEIHVMADEAKCPKPLTEMISDIISNNAIEDESLGDLSP